MTRSPEQVQHALDAVFKRPEFDERPSFFRLGELLARFFAWLASLHGTAPVLYWVLLLGCVILLGLLLSHLGWVVYSALFYRRGGSSAAERQWRRHLSRDYAEAASQAARAGDYTEAVRCLFLSLVYHFDESGRVTYLPSGTNREYLAGFADRPAVYRDLALFVDILDDNWYGQQTTSPQQYQRCRSVFDAIDTQWAKG
jgi:hypothetical protein